jgi:hypothetical protein
VEVDAKEGEVQMTAEIMTSAVRTIVIRAPAGASMKERSAFLSAVDDSGVMRFTLQWQAAA